MNYEKTLLYYMELLDCNINELCQETGLSYSLIHRYINGKRTPKQDSEYFNKIIDGLYNISIQKNKKISKLSFEKNFKKSLQNNQIDIDIDLLIDNFNFLQNELSFPIIDIARAIGYDPSFISRMKNKERKPADLELFIDKFRNYIFSLCKNSETKEHVEKIIKLPFNDISSFNESFTEWLCSKHIDNKPNEVLSLLTKIDNFNLNDYISTDFSKIKVPTVPVLLKNSKVFYGIEGRKQAEGEFLKTTLLSKSDESIFFYSDLPITQAGEDEEFKKKWVFAMSVLLKRGLHLNIVHNLNRPINELLLGLENWIPIYMSGSISPYYFKNPPSNFFNGSQCTSGSIALTSECIKYNEKKSKFYLTTKKEEVEFEKEKSNYMLSKATPLMKIFKEADKKEFNNFMNENNNGNITKIKKDIFKNINFHINENNWIIINKENSPEIHFVIYHEKLINAIKTFLLS